MTDIKIFTDMLDPDPATIAKYRMEDRTRELREAYDSVQARALNARIRKNLLSGMYVIKPENPPLGWKSSGPNRYGDWWKDNLG